MERKPFAVANWKMAMIVADALAFARYFVEEPAPPEHVARGAGLMRTWLGDQFGSDVAKVV